MEVNELLIWARGPAFNMALAIFVFGMLLRLFEIISLGRKSDLSAARDSGLSGGLRTIFSRSLPRKTVFAREPLRILNGYILHIGLFVVIFFYRPHIELLGLDLAGLSSSVIDAVTVITILSLFAALLMRLYSPVLQHISTVGDYLAWLITLLPLITGYMAYHHLMLDYTQMLAYHILSVELLLVLAPFTKLTHMFSFVLARWYQGYLAGRRGVES
ncbi:MAG: hypothetical protein HON68_04425 [Gammaproteobacteria bacterium]|jgi:nitrate reductase gamma subunit|nr:hypothetical protein [Gammaproteobacteria bacterium]MBT3488841.1 hypothetical protein [Gammaproteobacteria bacterium]MBT3718808.1 hypothetical protein [Gammaproteobacteria bacterium]MBT3845878.1 hypothetical protein [Gammaproteobacteria bacterium]MBT3894251.1 hypothetical protein [Gammaproteobacteria bacterium]